MNKLIAIILTTLTISALAQEQDAKEILDKLSATTKSYKNITIQFSFTLENKNQNIKEYQEGLLILEDEKFQLTINNQKIINNGETQWIYLTDMNEVQIMENDPEDNMITPKRLFTIYEEEYKYKYVGSKLEKGKDLEMIDLFPKESSEFMKINIISDAKKNQLEQITLYDKNGGTYTYLVNSFQINTAIDPFIFNTNEFPGIEIIDLR